MLHEATLRLCYCRSLHRALALGQLTASEKTEMAEIYAKQKYNHLTFFRTLTVEIQQQLGMELLLHKQLLSPEILCSLPAETLPPLRRQFVLPKPRSDAKSENISNLTSCFLNDEEKGVAKSSHERWVQLRSDLIEAAAKFGATKRREQVRTTGREFSIEGPAVRNICFLSSYRSQKLLTLTTGLLTKMCLGTGSSKMTEIRNSILK